MEQTSDEIEQVHTAIKQAIIKAIPVLNTVELYDPLKHNRIVTPAALIENVEMDVIKGEVISGGRLPITLQFAVHCCLSTITEGVELEIRKFAAKMLKVVNKNRWGLSNVKDPTELAAFPGMFKPDNKGYESWVVTWKQTIHLGDVWEGKDFLPQEVYLSAAPNIGKAHKDDYQQG